MSSKREICSALGIAVLLTGLVCYVLTSSKDVVIETEQVIETSSVFEESSSSSDSSSIIDRRTYTEDFTEFSPILPDKNKDDSSESEEIQISKLLDKTKDGVGWLQIPDTHIDYPVVQSVNNWYYLNHNAYGDYQYNGSLFLDYRNNADMSDFVTIIYGHNMKDFQLFADLDWFTNKDFFDKHRWLWYIDRERVYSLEVLGCGLVPDGSYVFDVFGFGETEVFSTYLYNLSLEQGFINKCEDFDLSTSDKYVMLCTCTDTMGSDGRYSKVFVLTRIADSHTYK